MAEELVVLLAEMMQVATPEQVTVEQPAAAAEHVDAPQLARDSVFAENAAGTESGAVLDPAAGEDNEDGGAAAAALFMYHQLWACNVTEKERQKPQKRKNPHER